MRHPPIQNDPDTKFKFVKDDNTEEDVVMLIPTLTRLTREVAVIAGVPCTKTLVEELRSPYFLVLRDFWANILNGPNPGVLTMYAVEVDTIGEIKTDYLTTISSGLQKSTSALYDIVMELTDSVTLRQNGVGLIFQDPFHASVVRRQVPGDVTINNRSHDFDDPGYINLFFPSNQG